MFTQLTQTTIAILYDIANGGIPNHSKKYELSIKGFMSIVIKLEQKGLIRLKLESKKELISSYELTYPMNQITLLDILEAIGEEIDCKRFIPEKIYEQAKNETNWPKTIDRIIRAYFEEIKLTDLQDVCLVD